MQEQGMNRKDVSGLTLSLLKYRHLRAAAKNTTETLKDKRRFSLNWKQEFVDSNLTPYSYIIAYPTAFPYGNGMVLHFYQQQESSTTKTVHKVINKGLKAYV